MATKMTAVQKSASDASIENLDKSFDKKLALEKNPLTNGVVVAHLGKQNWQKNLLLHKPWTLKKIEKLSTAFILIGQR
jgi:hypothetical protein